MTPAARLSAAIGIVETIMSLRQPAAQVVKEWGAHNRYAGSKDRSAISSFVYDSLRVRASACWLMGADTARAAVLGSLMLVRGMDAPAIAALCTGDKYAPAPLSDAELARLDSPAMDGAPAHVRADIPDWLSAPFQRAFGDDLVREGQAMARRAPVDMRVNLLKTTREKALAGLSHLAAQATPLSPWGLRIAASEDGRGPALAGEPLFVKGHIEIQDEGSQLSVLLSGVGPGWQVLDFCAGAGGKTLALASAMDNRGQIYATDSDGRRLMPIYKRLENSGSRTVQVRAPKGPRDILADLEDRCQLVFADAPCTGSGTWRRNPDAKWRIRPGALEQRIKDQEAVLAAAVKYVRPGGRLVYVTCSVLCEENEDRVAAFLETHPGFAPVDTTVLANACGVPALAAHASRHGAGFRLSPASTGTDGFYIAVLARLS